MPVSVAAGVEVVFEDSEPPGVDGAAAVVGVVVAVLAVVVVVLVPADAVVVVVGAAAAVVVVVPLPPVVVVVLLCDPEEFDGFLEAEGLDEPQAAAISPAAMTTPAILSELPLWRRARLGVDAIEFLLLGTVVALVPLVCVRMVRGPPGSPLRQCPLSGRRFLTKSVNNVKYLDTGRFIVSIGLVDRSADLRQPPRAFPSPILERGRARGRGSMDLRPVPVRPAMSPGRRRRSDR
jgi:hypothetical protein